MHEEYPPLQRSFIGPSCVDHVFTESHIDDKLFEKQVFDVHLDQTRSRQASSKKIEREEMWAAGDVVSSPGRCYYKL